MDYYKSIVKNVISPLWALKDGSRHFSYLADLERTQFWPIERLRELQLIKLRSMLEHAFANCSYYHNKWLEVGFNAKNISDFSDLIKLPILTKDDLRKSRNELIAKNYSRAKLFEKRTGGSVGVPVRVFVDECAKEMKFAATLRHNRWAGFDIGEKVSMVWGNPDHLKSFKARLRNLLLDRVVALDTLKMNEASMYSFVEAIRRFKPSILFGHAYSLFVFAKFVEANNYNNLCFRSIISTAMALSETQRAQIEKTFQCKVFDRYGSEEVSLIASECEAKEGLHIFSEGLLVESVRNNRSVKEGEEGSIVITDLNNRAMPLIRYRIEDVGVPIGNACSCGRALPMLKKIMGRVSDYVFTPEGDLVFGISVLDNLTIHIPGLKQCQIIQDRLDHLLIKIVPGNDFSRETTTILRQKLPHFFGRKMEFDFEEVSQISPEKSGKYRFCISKVKNPFL